MTGSWVCVPTGTGAFLGGPVPKPSVDASHHHPLSLCPGHTALPNLRTFALASLLPEILWSHPTPSHHQIFAQKLPAQVSGFPDHCAKVEPSPSLLPTSLSHHSTWFITQHLCPPEMILPSSVSTH